MPNEPVLTVRIDSTLVGIDFDKIPQTIFSPDVRPKWDDTLHSYKVIEKISDHVDYLHEEYSLPFPFSKRDFVKFRQRVSYKSEGLKKEDLELIQ